MRLNFGPLTQRGTLIALCILVAALLSIIFHLNRRYYDCLSRYNYECPMRLTGLWLQTSARHQFSSVSPPTFRTLPPPSNITQQSVGYISTLFYVQDPRPRLFLLAKPYNGRITLTLTGLSGFQEA